MDAMRAWADSEFAGGPKTIRSYFQNSGIYIFLISFGCVYYLSNAELLLGHYDLGWHLAAGDLLRDRGNIPFQDPWSFTLGDRQQSLLALGRDCQCVVSIYQLQRPRPFRSWVRRGYRRISRLDLPEQRSLGRGCFYFRFLRMFALPVFCDTPEYLPRRLTQHMHHVVLRHFLRRMPEEDEMSLVARDHVPLG